MIEFHNYAVAPYAPGAGGGYLPESTALFARFTTPPTNARKTLINTLIKTLKDGGVWSKLDALYLTAAADAQAARRNWISDAFNLTAINSPTFTTDRGYAGDGSSSYLNTGFNPTTVSSPMYMQNSSHISAWNRTTRAATDKSLMGARQSTTKYIDLGPRIVSGGGGFLGRMGGVTGFIEPNTNSDGHFVVNRASSAGFEGYRNASPLGSAAIASITPPNSFIALLGRSFNDSTADALTTDQIAAATIGGSLSAGDVSILNGALNAYLIAIGAA